MRAGAGEAAQRNLILNAAGYTTGGVSYGNPLRR